MIAIVNTGPKDDPNPMGWRDYEVRINRDVICRFKHKRSNGLGRCLMEAARAVEQAQWLAAYGAITDTVLRPKEDPHL